jgi:uncharacterized protein HemY
LVRKFKQVAERKREMASDMDMYGLNYLMGGQMASQMGQIMTREEYMRRHAEEYQRQQMKELAAKVQCEGQKPVKNDDSKLLLLLED